MKTFSQIFFLLAAQICFAQWFWQNPLQQVNAIRDVSFTDANEGTVLGDYDTIVSPIQKSSEGRRR